MTRKMTVGAAAAAFFGTILAASATDVAGVAWNAEFTNTWFVADMSSVASSWVPPESGTAEASDGAVVFETEVGDPLRYVPAAPSGPVALVNVQMVVDPNAATPPTDGLEYAQAALSVVTNNEGYLEWIGLTKDSGLKWEKLYGDNPTSGSTYDVQIAVDNHGNAKKIRYAVKGAGAFTVLTNSSGNAWLANPQASATSVTNVAFAGAGTIKSLGGSNVVGKVVVDSFSDSVTDGYDFTNGIVTAVVQIPSGSGVGMSAKLVVKNASGTIVKTITGQEITSPSVAFDLTGLDGGSSLNAGATYTYEFSIDYGDGNYVPTKSGTFVAANWSSDCLFGGVVSGSTANVTNGVMNGAVAGDDKWSVDTNAVFEVANTALGANQVTRVDTSYLFDSFIDVDSLEPLDKTAVGGIVAVSDGGNAFWYAWTSAGWRALAGDIAPKTNTEYVVRAEFDFKSARKVCYYVSEGNSDAFCPLTLDGNMMIDFANDSVTTLSSVEMAGKGSVKSICAKLADASVAKIDDVKYGSLWEAVKAANGDTITLLTNATLTPGATGGKYRFLLNNAAGFDYKPLLTGTWKIVEDGEGNLYLVKPAATYIFF